MEKLRKEANIPEQRGPAPDFRDRLSMIGEHGRRIPLFPAEVKGFWRSHRTWVQSVLILFLLVLPWLQIGGKQAVLFDLVRRDFIFFGAHFQSHDVPLVFFILAFLTLMLALVTTLFGRAWCGWACPQTVFIDGVYRRIERWTEGTHLQRRELARSAMSFSKARKKTLKWILFLAFTAILSHSFLAYFVGAGPLIEMVQSDPYQNWTSFLFILVTTGLLLFNFVWFREQFCLIVCPYGRFQSVLMDSQSVTVQYDSARGEPRKGTEEKGTPRGACVSCNRCVHVCPTGIDIRNGIQMECIACTACIDACDDIMDKVNQPRGLIRYSTPTGAKAQMARPRVLFYSVLLFLISIGFIFSLWRRSEVQFTFLRALDTPYIEKAGPNNQVIIVNAYRLHVQNHSDQELRFDVTFDKTESRKNGKIEIPTALLQLRARESRMIPFLIEIPRGEIPDSGVLPMKLRVLDQTYEVQIVGPKL